MSTLPLACGDHTFPLLEHEHAIALISMLGMQGFDLALMGARSHVRPEDVRHDIPAWATRLGKSIDAAGLRLSDVFVIPWPDIHVMAPNSPDADERARARALFADMLELAARLEAPGLTMLPGANWDGEPHLISLERAADELAWRAAAARRIGLRFSIEAHIDSVCASPEDVLQLVEWAPDVELTLDYTHFVAQGFAQERIDPLTRHARHFHARGGRKGRAQCALRDNEIDYRAIVRRLLDEDYDGHLALEYVWIDWEQMNDCDNVSETVMLRDALLAHMQGRPWAYTPPAG